MATVDALSIAYINKRVQKLTDYAVKFDPFLKKLKEMGRIMYNCGWSGIAGAGVDLYWNTKNGYLTTAVSPGDYTPIAGHIEDNQVKVTAPMSKLADAIAFSIWQKRRLANMPSRDTNYNMIEQRMKSIRQGLAQNMSTDLLSDGTQRTGAMNSQVMVGAAAIVKDDNTLYGVDRSQTANAYARSVVKATSTFLTADSLGNTDGIKKMKQVDRALSVLGKQKGDGVDDSVEGSFEGYDIVLVDTGAAEFYELALDPKVRGINELKDGYQNDLPPFKNHPVILSPFMSTPLANTMLFLKLAHWTLETDCSNGKLFENITEDDTNIVQAVILGGQHCLYCEKPSAQGRLNISG